MEFNENNHSNFSDQNNSNPYGWNPNQNTNANQNSNSNTDPNYNANGNMNQNPNYNNNNQSNPYNQNNTYQSYNSYQNWNQQPTYQYQPYQEEKKKVKKDPKPKDPNHKSFAGVLAKCAAIALVLGVVGGSIFTGTSYMLKNATKDDVSARNASASANKSDKSSSKSSMVESTEKSNSEASSQASDKAAQNEEIASVVNNAMPSIVAITNMGETQQNALGQSGESESAGSGIIVKQDDKYLYIVTNNHVVEESSSLTVQFIDNSTASATIKGTDSDSDLAVIEVPVSGMSQDTLSKIKVATLGSSDTLKVGEGAIAIGNALGYGQSVTTGVISALNREVSIQDDTTGETISNSLIQTDAAINPGNSGGALLNMKGEVIGINEMKYSDTSVEGMGYSIPMSTASPIITELINRQQIDAANQAYLGISGVNVTDQIASAYNMPKGVYVASVLDGSAAASAGIQQGDIITKFDGKDIKTMEELKNMISGYTAGTKVEVILSRSNNGNYAEQKIEVTLGTKPQTNK